jgi:hypothetical protein
MGRLTCRSGLRATSAVLIAALTGLTAMPALAQKDAYPVAPDALRAGATTHGGAVKGARIIHVTTLADNGPGSLRAALDQSGARIIVFDVGGRIQLASEIKIHQPFVTIAGQTAPSPGIALWGDSLRIRTHDVVVQHLVVRAGPGATPKINDNRDAISIDGSPKAPADRHSYQIRLENVSASWSVDEALSLWYATTRQVTIRRSIVSEALRNAGHPKGQHSMGLLVGSNVQTAEITGNLLASNSFRNPVIGKGASAFVANNYIANPGQNAIHFYPTGSTEATRATVVNNWIEAGADTRKAIGAVMSPLRITANSPKDEVFFAGNDGILNPLAKLVAMSTDLIAVARAPVWTPGWPLKPTQDVRADVLRYAGSRPRDRDAVDRRLLDQIRAGKERIVDAPPEAGSPPPQPTARTANVPKDPFSTAPGTKLMRIEAWLCEQHFAVGGAPSAECPG